MNFNPSTVKKVASGLVAISGLVIVGILYKRYKREQKRKTYPKDVVILHQYPRGLYAPSPSPYALKLETWLRMADIKYQNEFAFLDSSSKAQVPYITFNDEDVADSQFSIEFLSKKFDKDLNKNLSSQERGVARAILKLTEESLKWPMALHRLVYAPNTQESGLPLIVIKIFKSKVSKAAYGQGYGRHSKDEVYSIGKDDMTAINDIIGDTNKFTMGNQASEVDATVFGMVSQILFHQSGPLHQHLKNNCPNLLRVMNNIKATYWPDWNECIRYKKK